MSGALRHLKMLILLLGDAAAAELALLAALFLRYRGDAVLERWREHAGPFAAVFLLWFVIFYIVGLYEPRSLRNRLELVARTSEGLGASFLVSLAVFYLVPFFRIAPKTNLVITVAVFAVLFLGWRLLMMQAFARRDLRIPTLFIGSAPESEELHAALSGNPHLGYEVVGVLDEIPDAELPPADLIVVSHHLPDDGRATRVLYERAFSGAAVLDLPSFYEEIHRAVPASALDKRWVLENIARRRGTAYDALKRPFDILLAAVLLIPLAALLPLIALAIKLEDGGPVFFAQTRVGRNGRPFTMMKFRTMRTDAEKEGAAFASERDGRVTRIGRFLRASRLDELPQAWNILKGEMSFVGPRPERPEFERELSEAIPLFPVRRLARPGLTGWAQVHAPYAGDLDEHHRKLRHDLYYLKHMSFTLDAAVLLKTVYSVFKRKGR